MPLLKTAQEHSCFDLPPANLYCFCDDHRPGWSAFWKDMGGDRDKIVEWAKKAEIDEPEGWFNDLHKFLFGLYSGDYKLMKKAAAKTFSEYLSQVSTNHVDNPKDKWWYINHGALHKDFIASLERASEIQDLQSAIHYLNAKVPKLGSHLFDEYLLSKAGYLKSIQAAASKLREEAYGIETEICSFDPFEAGDIVCHANFPSEKFKVVGVVDGIIMAESGNGEECYLTDPWNVEMA